MCKKLKLIPANKWYQHKPKCVQENVTYNNIWSYESKRDHPIPATRPDLEVINKKRNCVDFPVPVDHRVKMKERKKVDKYLALARDLKKIVEHEADGDNNF